MATASNLHTNYLTGGYASLLGQTDGGDAEEVIDDENGILISGLLRLHFSNVQSAELFKHIADKHHNHWDMVLKKMQGLDLDEPEDLWKKTIARRAGLRWRRLAGHKPDLEKQMREHTGELFEGWKSGIAPRLEGRVRAVSKTEALNDENGQLQDMQKSSASAQADGHSAGEEKSSESWVERVKTAVVETLSNNLSNKR